MSLINFIPCELEDRTTFKLIDFFDRSPDEPSMSWAEEDDDQIRLSMDLPDTTASGLHVTVTGGLLEVSGSRPTKTPDAEAAKQAQFGGSFSLDLDAVDASNIKANLCNGILVVQVPKKKMSPK